MADEVQRLIGELLALDDKDFFRVLFALTSRLATMNKTADDAIDKLAN
jgi:hypothetical protein